MAIYVDEVVDYAHVRPRLKQTQWSHMVSDLDGEEGTQELIAFAVQLGLKPHWIQHAGRSTEHFDIVPSIREKALRLGAISMSGREISHQITLPKMKRMRENNAATGTEDRMVRASFKEERCDGEESS